jgi:hypothetical protein
MRAAIPLTPAAMAAVEWKKLRRVSGIVVISWLFSGRNVKERNNIKLSLSEYREYRR